METFSIKIQVTLAAFHDASGFQGDYCSEMIAQMVARDEVK